MNPVGWFEIPVTDMERATKFYGTVFNTELSPLPMEKGEMMAFPWKDGAP